MTATELPRPGHGDEERATAPDPDFIAFVRARERFLAHLRRDSELRRLERLWSLGAHEPGERPGGG